MVTTATLPSSRSKDGKTDLVAFGKLVHHPTRIWSSASRRMRPSTRLDRATFYGGGAKGYTDSSGA